MATHETRTLTVTIDAPFGAVAMDLAEPINHVAWGTEFFSGPPRDAGDGTVVATVPLMGGDVAFRVEGDVALGVFDLYLAPVGAPFGPPLPVRLVPNGDGVDVLWTLARMNGASDEQWAAGLASMERELDNLRMRHER